MIFVGVRFRPAYDNCPMDTTERADLLPWILAAVVVAIMGAAVALYPTESEVSNSSAQTHAPSGDGANQG